MSPISHSVLTNTTLSTAKKLKTPLKASVVLLTTVILASCGSDSGSKSYYSDSTDIPTAPETDGGETDGGETDGGETGSNTDDLDEIKAELEKAKAEAAAQKAKAEAAQKEAETAKSELADAKKALVEAEQALADALASGGGDPEALQAEVDRRQAALDAANKKAAAAQQAAADAIAAAEKQAQDAQDALQAANDAAKAAEIKNAPESAKSGVQTLNVDVVPLGKVFKTTTRDFSADDNSVVARADLASESAPGAGDGLLGQLTITTSGDGDTDVEGSNGFKAHDDNATVGALGQELPLTYTSTYKDFGDDMRIGHIDGKAVFSGLELPVNGAAVVGNATKVENMPTEGTVGYTGDATHRKLGIGNAIEFGSSVFTADFVKKNLEGKLSFAKAGDIALKAGINGNQFSGAADANNGYATEGGFYGGDAQYLGGVYEGNGAQGTYGAKSDAQTAAEKAAVDAKKAADAAQAAIAEQQAKAEAAKAAAEKAQADAEKAKAALEKAQENLDNAGEGGDGGLADALARAEAAEVAQAAAEDLAAKAQAAQKAAEEAKAAAEKAQAAAQAAADKAVGEAKAEAEKLVAEAKAETDAANEAAQTARAEADAAKKAAEKAKTDADALVAEANKQKEQAEADALQAQKDADAANKLAADEKAKAEAAQKEAETAKSELADAQKALEEAEQALADALASGGGNTEALQAEVDRRDAALKAANEKAAAAQKASEEALAAAQKQVEDAQAALQAATDAAEAAKIKNEPEADKSGVQTINVGTTAAGLPEDFAVTTRDFDIGKDNVIARADIASNNLLPKVNVNISGEGDRALSNGLMSHNDSTSIKTSLGELPLEYTSVYKDYGDDMRIGHIDGAASLGETKIPVDGVAVVGNATQADNMPTTEGTVGYTGDATHRKLGLGNAIEFGSSVFTADFVNKNLEGKLSFAKAGDIALKAGIDGNQFSGAAADNAGYATEGGFYGGDAQYLGGVYEGNGAQGTYGAKSDVQTAAEKAAAEAQAAAKAAQEAIAVEQAKADAAQAAADKAKADAAKAQEALEKAQEALKNAGDGESALESALERARLAEEAQKAAEEVATKAQAAEAAAKEAQATAEKAQQAAEQAAIDAKNAADKAIGDAKAEADKLVAEANTAADAAKAEAEKARAAAEQAAKDTETANKEKQDALIAKAEAEAAAEEAQARADAAEELANQFDEPDSAISGVQHTRYDDKQHLVDSYATGYDKLVLRTHELNENIIASPIVVDLKGANDTSLQNGFKSHTGSVAVLGKNALGTPVQSKYNYTSVYNNFDDQMQIGHVSGKVRRTYDRDELANVYVKGNATNLGDLQKLADGKETTDGTAKYTGVATYKEGAKLDVNGKSKFDVDFVNKSVDGTLTFNAGKNITIAADIDGNKFAGNVNGINTSGGFFGKGADYLGGVYEGNGAEGTYGAERVKPVTEPEDPNAPVNPDVDPDSEMTGFQSSAFSSLEANSSGFKKFEDAIGYVAIRDDASDFTDTETITSADGIESEVPIDNRKGNNFTAFDKGVVRGDMVQPASVIDPIAVNLQAKNGTVKVNAGLGSFLNPDFKYNAVYQNFDSQMQVGHVYGVINSGVVGDVSRVANVYVQGHLTAQEDIDYLKQVNEGKASYAGQATYIENIHLGDSGSFKPVEGTSSFDVDFVNNSVKGELAFDGDFKYMPEGNKIGIEATIDGNTFAGNVNGIDTAGGFYGEDAKFLGGIYQDASVEGGKGQGPGTGTKFQGTFGAEKQPAK
ncbi:Transferrin binding protein-like solute binding protein [Psychrobacter pasteurii]|uniref:Transferrin binding protein-like solute binding protein n=1 Tax=Psychrobacter pasteurii TaxID=1945520 RepID=A0A1R4EC62_9GAMM|nr:transferrin-binding protein-like solute binding protein [Psychrobacter pasteurii]SJM36075.1 Transferrin binding protein-like solute binding protein [Psychrobacter pasteurii]